MQGRDFFESMTEAGGWELVEQRCLVGPREAVSK